jgi:hypothetical protein
VIRKNSLWGYEANVVRGLLCCERGYLNLLFGFREVGLDEDLAISETLLTLPLIGGMGTNISVQDRFVTSNRFYGGQIGLAGEYRLGNWSFGGKAKVALGSTGQWAEIMGLTVASSGGMTQTGLGGLLALPGTNMGHYYREAFSVVPEGTFTIGYQIRPWCRATIGYNFLYMSSVIRPGGLIDRNVNASFQPGAAINPNNFPASANPRQPMPLFTTTDFWAQGLTLGLEFTW